MQKITSPVTLGANPFSRSDLFSLKDLPTLPKGNYSPWLFQKPITLSTKMALAILLDFSSVLLPDHKGIPRAYWSNWRNLFQLLCFIVLESRAKPLQRSLKHYLTLYNQAVTDGSSQVNATNDVHRMIYFSFVKLTEKYTHGMCNSQGYTPMGVANILKPEACFSPHRCTICEYMKPRYIVRDSCWYSELKKTKYVHENLAQAILKLGFEHQQPKNIDPVESDFDTGDSSSESD